MDHNLPGNPSNPNNNNSNPPPAFGSDFNPHLNSPDPNNPYQQSFDQPPQNPTPQVPQPPAPTAPNISDPHHPTHSDVAKHRQRDEYGHFLPYEHPVHPQPQTLPTNLTSQTTPIQQNQPNPSILPGSSNSSFSLPPLIETNPKEYTPDPDPPIVTVRNPITYIKKWWNKIMAKEGVDFKLGFKIKPITAVLIASIIISGGVSSGVTALVLKTFWPTSSPILHRQIIQQGTIQTGTGGFYLVSSDQSMWKLKPKKPNINLADQVGKQVTVTGNMTKEANLIEVSEIILSDSSQTPLPPTPSLAPRSLGEVGPNIPNQDLLPKLYSGLQRDLTQRKVLIFTSGKRKIEQEGVYMESAQVADFPQEFINYYTNQLTNTGFKETLNSSDPNGTTITYAKDDLFLTYGVKNIYSGSGDNKKLVGYKAFIEHN